MIKIYDEEQIERANTILKQEKRYQVREHTRAICLAPRLHRSCKCHKIPVLKKPELISDGRLINYPKSEKSYFKTFEIEYDQALSYMAKIILNTFTNKYLYHAIDDILYLARLNPIEKENLLSILYSPVISLHNDFSVNFFDIWIHHIYIKQYSTRNKFLKKKIHKQTLITVELWYKIKVPVSDKELIW